MDANENVPKEAIMAVKHIELIAPLLPPGKLAVVIEGSPLRSSHIRALNPVISTAARHGAHRTEGVAKIHIKFDSMDAGNAYEHGASRAFPITISRLQRFTRIHRILLLLVIGFSFRIISAILCKRV